MDETGGRTQGQTNVLGEPIASYRMIRDWIFRDDGCCNTGPLDIGMHTVCAVMTEAFWHTASRQGMTCRRRTRIWVSRVKSWRSMVCVRPGGSRLGKLARHQKCGLQQQIGETLSICQLDDLKAHAIDLN